MTMKVPSLSHSLASEVGEGSDEAAPRATAAGDGRQGEVGYKQYGLTGVS